MTTDWKPSTDDLESITAAKEAFKPGNTNDDVIKFYSEWVKEGKYQKVCQRSHFISYIPCGVPFHKAMLELRQSSLCVEVWAFISAKITSWNGTSEAY